MKTHRQMVVAIRELMRKEGWPVMGDDLLGSVFQQIEEARAM